jgi:hypothetical protein
MYCDDAPHQRRPGRRSAVRRCWGRKARGCIGRGGSAGAGLHEWFGALIEVRAGPAFRSRSQGRGPISSPCHAGSLVSALDGCASDGRLSQAPIGRATAMSRRRLIIRGLEALHREKRERQKKRALRPLPSGCSASRMRSAITCAFNNLRRPSGQAYGGQDLQRPRLAAAGRLQPSSPLATVCVLLDTWWTTLTQAGRGGFTTQSGLLA